MNKSFYVYSDGTLKRKDNTLRFIKEDGTQRDLPIEHINDLYLMNEVTLNTNMLNLLSQYGVIVHFFNYYSFYIGSFYPREHLLAGNLLVKQVEFYLDDDKRVDLAKRFILAASANIYRNLRYYNGRGKDLQEAMSSIQIYRSKIEQARSVGEVMGYEGNIRKIYYNSWRTIIDQEIDFDKRVMHPPDNMINSLISFVNTLVYTKVLTQIYKTQLNPTISYLHEPGVRRFSLCLDLAEVFKPLIGDRLIFALLNRKQINQNSFTKKLDFLHLEKDASRTITEELDKRLQQTIMHKDLGKDVTYEYLIRLEAYKLIKHIMGEKQYEGFEIWW